MNNCINCFNKCNSNAKDKLDTYICQGKARYCFGQYAKKCGTNNYWPWQSFSTTPDTSYIGVIDLDGNRERPLRNGPFAIPPEKITTGNIGMVNRAKHYQFLHGGVYGGVLKCGAPATRDPLYY